MPKTRPDELPPHRRTPFGDRRTATRRVTRREVLLRGKRAAETDQENALIEDRSSSGVCLRSALAIKRGDALLLSAPRGPMRAVVVWSRRDGILVSRRTGKPCAAYVAGCRVQPLKEKARNPSASTHRWSTLLALGVRYGALAGGLGLLGVLVYWIVSLVLRLVV